MNELQMSSYARQYYVLGVETRDHEPQIIKCVDKFSTSQSEIEMK